MTSNLHLAAGFALILFAGCSQPAGPNQSYASALEQLEQHRDAIRDAFAQGTPEASDAAIHEVGYVLTALPRLARQEDMSKEQQRQVEASVEKLSTQFDLIHEGFHGQGAGSSYDDVADEIERAIKSLPNASGP